MKTVQEIIDRKGGLDALKNRYIKVLNKPYMPLVIEYVGQGPHGLPLVSVAHYFEQHGDLMRDPEIVFEVPTAASGQRWLPISIQQDPVGSYREAVYRNEEGRLMVKLELVEELHGFARMWDRNIKEQGFLEAAEADQT